jgi:hypothetical protein
MKLRRPRVGPRYVDASHSLFVGDVLVKRFKQPADDQEAILAAFEQAGWPESIHNPFRNRTRNTKHRLRDAIARLNRCQVNNLIRFHNDSTGMGIWWELVAPSPPAYSQNRESYNREMLDVVLSFVQNCAQLAPVAL